MSVSLVQNNINNGSVGGCSCFVCQGGQEKSSFTIDDVRQIKQTHHFRTETRIERKTQSYSGYTHTQRGVESEKGGFWFASKKLTNISVEYNNFIVH